MKAPVPPNIAEALAHGRGVERPFRCSEHPDRNASASINSLTGLWYCHSCGAKGKTDTAEPPEADVILEMLSLGQTSRVYPLAWLDLFDTVEPTYWLKRFPDPDVVRTFRLGVHPVTGYPTFPVFGGPNLSQLMGIGMRRLEGKPRYVYPHGFKASQSFGIPVSPWAPHQVVVLVEGIADAVALAMSGITAWACWGAGLHAPQTEMLTELEVGNVLLGFDNDLAGQRARQQVLAESSISYLAMSIQWPNGIKDPAEMEPGDEVFNHLVSQVRYRSPSVVQVLERQRSWWRGEYCQDG